MNTTESVIEYLNRTNCEIKKIKSYIPDIHYGKVIKVYDGDTITIASPLYNGDTLSTFELYKFNIRILGVDTPELKTKNDVEHLLGIAARDALYELIINKVVRLEDVSYDKYGRILCNLFLDDTNISEWLISKKFAVKYDGGTKIKNWNEPIN